MTLAEFKAWFEGFTEEMDEAPTKKQWERIKKRVKEIDGSPATERVFVERYWPVRPPRGWWELVNGQYQACSNDLYQSSMQARAAMEKQPPQSTGFNSAQFMCELGRAEYKSEAA